MVLLPAGSSVVLTMTLVGYVLPDGESPVLVFVGAYQIERNCPLVFVLCSFQHLLSLENSPSPMTNASKRQGNSIEIYFAAETSWFGDCSMSAQVELERRLSSSRSRNLFVLGGCAKMFCERGSLHALTVDSWLGLKNDLKIQTRSRSACDW